VKAGGCRRRRRRQPIQQPAVDRRVLAGAEVANRREGLNEEARSQGKPILSPCRQEMKLVSQDKHVWTGQQHSEADSRKCVAAIEAVVVELCRASKDSMYRRRAVVQKWSETDQ